MKKLSFLIITIIATFSLPFLGACNLEEEAKQDAAVRRAMEESVQAERERSYFLIAQYRCEYLEAATAVGERRASLEDFLVSNGYHSEFNHLADVQKKWNFVQWKEYAHALERLNEASEEQEHKEHAYLTVLEQNGLYERGFAVWYDRTIGGEVDPKEFIRQKLFGG